MINMSDIYYTIDSYMVENGFNKTNIEGKKALLESGLKKYMSNKITSIDPSKSIKDDDLDNISVNDLAITLGELIPEEEHTDTLRHLTHYVLGVAGAVQGYSIVWFTEDEPTYIASPLVEFTEQGKWDSLKTHRDTSYVTAFEFAYDVFKNTLMSKTKDNKQLVLTRNQLLKDDE